MLTLPWQQGRGRGVRLGQGTCPPLRQHPVAGRRVGRRATHAQLRCVKGKLPLPLASMPARCGRVGARRLHAVRSSRPCPECAGSAHSPRAVLPRQHRVPTEGGNVTAVIKCAEVAKKPNPLAAGPQRTPCLSSAVRANQAASISCTSKMASRRSKLGLLAAAANTNNVTVAGNWLSPLGRRRLPAAFCSGALNHEKAALLMAC